MPHATRPVQHTLQHQSATSTSSPTPEPVPVPQHATAGRAVSQLGRSLAAGLQALALAGCLQLSTVEPSAAVLSNPNAKMPRSVDSALRRSIPALNPAVASVQRLLEDVASLMRIPQRKPWGTMSGRISDALRLFDADPARSLLTVAAPPARARRGAELLDELYSRLKQLQLAIGTQAASTVSIRIAAALDAVSELELVQAPGLAYTLPKEYANAPRLVGRAVVQLQFDRKDGAETFVDVEVGGTTSHGEVEVTIDGYSAPLTAANFLINVQAGLYDGRPANASYPSVLVTGDPARPRPPLPLEILAAGEFDPVYRLPLDIAGGELPVLPLSIPGAVAMAHLLGNDSYVSGDEFFIGKFNQQQAGLSGLAFDEGTFGVFGYVTKGLYTVEHLEPGDVLTKAVVLSGAEKLVIPAPKP